MRVNKFIFFFNFNNMDNIVEPNEMFDFSKISLGHPVGIQGGAYFTKIEFNKKPLYIQTAKSLTRQGIVKTGKKYYCDLMFDKNTEILINWFENLEDKCKKLIYEKKDAWFQGNLEENDIENAFNPLLRVYRSGKYYLLRTNIKNTKEDNPSVKIYNENEIILSVNDITPETEIISILEVQGIKFTSRNFQIEIELKQIMVLDNEPIFDNCLIKTNKKLQQKPLEDLNHVKIDSFIEIKDENDLLNEMSNTESIETQENKVTEIHDKKLDEIEQSIDSSMHLEELEPLDLLNDVKDKNTANENISLDIEFEDLGEDIQENNDILKEINNDDLNLDKNTDSMILKKPNQVYFELYKDARNKAKLAKKNAILAYLEAKNIKKTYMIENINDSDSDFDAEIDEVSESELEGL
jgi:hypothetical protein